jgi:glycosyltransferase involved in cell wall biosynthesis
MKNNSYVSKKSCTLILEYGIPHYRGFLFEFLDGSFREFHIYHCGERFEENDTFHNTKGFNLKIKGEFSLVFFNPIKIIKSDVIITTFNIYKPHTWIWIILMPWKNWILWGQGLGSSRSKLLLLFRKFILSLSKGYIVYTQFGRQKMIEHGIDPQKISIAGNTLQVNNHGLTKGSRYFLFVGRIQERKGLEIALEICSKLNLRFIIVGDGDKKLFLKKKYYGFKNILFLNSIYDENELKAIFENAIAYVSPNHVGLGVVHSFAYGTPVVTNKSKKHAPEFEYCSEENSYLYENDSQLENVLLDAMNNKFEREKKGEAAYNFYRENLSSERMIRSFEYHIEKII